MGILPLRDKETDKTTPIVVVCHGSVRAGQVCQYPEPLGFAVVTLEGKIKAWSRIIDPIVLEY